jgi:hypothetical protein
LKAIVAIGGAVIKTALEELKESIDRDKIEMLIHNGASLFHDFQRATDLYLKRMRWHSYPLDMLLADKELDRPASELVWNWIRGQSAPENSVTQMCDVREIPVLCFSALGCDFWQMFDRDWEKFASNSRKDMVRLVQRMMEGNFRYLLLGSAVIQPEVFRSALALAMPKVKGREFRADVVDFLDMYRPRTRVARYGNYYQMEFKEFLKKWNDGEIE